LLHQRDEAILFLDKTQISAGICQRFCNVFLELWGDKCYQIGGIDEGKSIAEQEAIAGE
jgi:hypothetical protein